MKCEVNLSQIRIISCRQRWGPEINLSNNNFQYNNAFPNTLSQKQPAVSFLTLLQYSIYTLLQEYMWPWIRYLFSKHTCTPSSVKSKYTFHCACNNMIFTILSTWMLSPAWNDWNNRHCLNFTFFQSMLWILMIKFRKIMYVK